MRLAPWIARLFSSKASPLTRRPKRNQRLSVELLEERAVPAGAGSFDTTFGSQGIVLINPGLASTPRATVFSLALQTDGKVLAGGTAYGASLTQDFALVRLNTDGTPDGTFGTNGRVLTDFSSGSESIYGLAIQADGKIVAVGTQGNDIEGRAGGSFLVARYNANGTLDKTLTLDPFPSLDGGFDVVIQPADGKIVIGGKIGPAAGNSFAAVLRLKADLTPDTGFGTNGIASAGFGNTDAAATKVLLQGDGRILVVGSASADGSGTSGFALARFNADGTPDSSFGLAGTLLADVGAGYTRERAFGAALLPGGKILTGGYAGNPNSFSGNDLVLMQFDTNGAFDNSFGTGGRVMLDTDGTANELTALALQADGSIVVAGDLLLPGGYDAMIARFTANGNLDQTFAVPPIGLGGVRPTDISPNGSDYFNAVLVLPNGNILAAGTTDYPPSQPTEMVLVRYLGKDNQRPTATDDVFATSQDVPVDIDPLANDTDPDRDTLSLTVVAAPQNGTLTQNANGTYKYTPNAGYRGTDQFSYRASDGFQTSNVAFVDLTISAPNNPPTATGEAYVTNEDEPLIVNAAGVLANDVDPDGDQLRATLDVAPVNGSLVLSDDGMFVYTPNRNYFGGDSFRYIASDGRGGTSSASVSIIIRSVNDAPIANIDRITIREDTTITVSPLANDRDAENDPLVIQSFTSALHGTVTRTSDQKLHYIPAANYYGYDRFYYTINDGFGGTAESAVTFNITSVNDAPVNTMPLVPPQIRQGGSVALTGVNTITVRDADSIYTRLTTTLTASNGTLRLGSKGNLTAASGSGTNTLSLTGNRAAINGALLTVRYTPAATFKGAARIVVVTSDNGYTGAGGPKRDLDYLFVGVDDRRPITTSAVPSETTYRSPANTKLVVSVEDGLKRFFTDPDAADRLAFVVVSPPATGTFSYFSSGTFSYTPTPNFRGRVSFTAKATDGVLESDVVTFNIDIF